MISHIIATLLPLAWVGSYTWALLHESDEDEPSGTREHSEIWADAHE
jgi:hypothetical protein